MFTCFTLTLCYKADSLAVAWRRRSNSLTCHTSLVHVHSSSHCHTCCIYAISGRFHKPQRRRRTRSFSVSTTPLAVCIFYDIIAGTVLAPPLFGGALGEYEGAGHRKNFVGLMFDIKPTYDHQYGHIWSVNKFSPKRPITVNKNFVWGPVGARPLTWGVALPWPR